MGYTVFKRNEKTGLECGINAYGELYLGDNESGYNLPNTPENKARILADFDYWNKDEEGR